MDKSKIFSVLILLLFCCCMWDLDTVEMENQQFPETIELITGNFLRHSPEYYQWRIGDREAKIKRFPDSVQLYDDLAVAYSKLHQDAKAIEIMFEKEKIKGGLYETYANLGTFYLHNGQMEQGIEYIEKALKINPNAHFGREKYQKYLAQYILTRNLNASEGDYQDAYLRGGRYFQKDNFWAFIEGKEPTAKMQYSSYQEAIEGVRGMMKFGNYDSPYLLEALGDLLVKNWEIPKETNPKTKKTIASATTLSSICYYLAFQKYNDPKQKRIAGLKYQYLLEFSREYYAFGRADATKLKHFMKKSLTVKNSIYEQIRQNEIAWIAKKLDVDSAFKANYYKKPKK